MKFEVEELRYKIFKDDLNEHLMKVIFGNIQRNHRMATPGQWDPINRQTGRTTMRILEGLNRYLKGESNVVYFINQDPLRARRMKEIFQECLEKLGFSPHPDSFLLIKSLGQEHDRTPAIYIYDHAYP